ncbi:AMP-binding protein [Nocardia fluminea]|uniref:AMP-binding protein n=1 Tax=Nocardia fluminea TaxID=134984 RepID=UPI0034286989
MTRAQLDGGEPPELAVASLPAALARTAESADTAVVCIDRAGEARTRGYAVLAADAGRISTALREHGVRPGEHVVIQVADTADLLTAFWGCQFAGATAIPVTAAPPPRSSLDADQLRSAVAETLIRPWILADRHTAARDTRRLGPLDELRDCSDSGNRHLPSPDDIATMLLTSGSTGIPKPVPLTHRNILGRTAATAALRQLSTRTRSLNWMPLHHVGGLVMFHLRDVVLGAHQIHADTDWILEEPLRWLQVAAEHACDTTWAPNFAFRLITDRASELAGKDWDLRQLRYIMNGGEAIDPAQVRRFHAVLAPFGLPDTAIHPGWGMTETSSGIVDVVVVAPDIPHSRFLPVGFPHPGVSIRIVDDEDRVVALDRLGHVQVTGTPVTSGYFGTPDSSRSETFTADGWFRTGDLGYVAEGLLTITGRGEERLTIDGVEIYGHEIESAVEELAFIEPSFTVACEVAGELTVTYHPRSGKASYWENWWIVQHVSRRFSITAVRAVAVPRESIPKTAMGKLRRAQLRRELEITLEMNSDTTVLQTIRLKGRPTLPDVAAATALSGTGLAATVDALVAAGHCRRIDDLLCLTPVGRTRLTALLDAERANLDHDRMEQCYARFAGPDTAVKTAITEWQLIEGTRPNDHTDPDYDAAVLQRLTDTHRQVQPLLAEIASLLPRLGRYPDRLATALARVAAGEHRWMSAPLIDSFHTVWFEFHEELIAATGRTRAREEAAGSAS